MLRCICIHVPWKFSRPLLVMRRRERKIFFLILKFKATSASTKINCLSCFYHFVYVEYYAFEISHKHEKQYMFEQFGFTLISLILAWWYFWQGKLSNNSNQFKNLYIQSSMKGNQVENSSRIKTYTDTFKKSWKFSLQKVIKLVQKMIYHQTL